MPTVGCLPFALHGQNRSDHGSVGHGKQNSGLYIVNFVPESRYHLHKSVPFARKRSRIYHLHISHNAPYLSPKLSHNLSFSFLLGI